MKNSLLNMNTKKSGISVLIIAVLVVFSTNIRAQVVAGFDIDEEEGCTPHTATFTNTSSSGTGDPMTYYWYFGDNTNSTLKDPSKVYNKSGDYVVSLVVTNSNNASDKDSISKVVTVIQTPAATLKIDSSYACVNELILFSFSPAPKDSLTLDFGDGTVSHQLTSPITHRYKSHSTYSIKFYTYYKACSDQNLAQKVVIDGPIADYSISNDSVCVGEKIQFALGENQIGVDSTIWFFGDGTTSKEDTIEHSYAQWGNYLPYLKVYSAKNCELAEKIHVYHVDANFGWKNDALCAERFVYFENSSIGNTNNYWDFGDGETSTLETPQHIFQTGNKIVKLSVSNEAGCADNITDTLFINDIPDISVGKDYWFVCQGQSVQLEAFGGDSIVWIPSDYLDNTQSYTPTATPPYTVNYQVYVYDTKTKCPNYGTIQVEVQQQPAWNVEINQTLDSIILGELDTVYVNLNGNYVSYWQSEDTILTYTKDYLVAQPIVARNDYATYYLTVVDSNGCFNYNESVDIFVREAYTVDVPKAFSPNGDEINDEFRVNGWGIKRLIELRIYNRWGTEVFYSDDLNTGWDGTINGKPQPIDSYAYVFKVEMWDDKVLEQKGTFTLVR